MNTNAHECCGRVIAGTRSGNAATQEVVDHGSARLATDIGLQPWWNNPRDDEGFLFAAARGTHGRSGSTRVHSFRLAGFVSGLGLLAVLVGLGAPERSLAAEPAKIVLVAGRPSHGPLAHEHRAGCLLWQKCLEGTPGVAVTVVSNGWPTDTKVFEGASAIVFYCDGGDGHPAIQPERLALLGSLMDRGVGLGCVHYGVEVPKDKGGPEFLKWTGGYFEAFWSVNPHWDADFKALPDHPVTRGVKPFKIRDEWYYHMRFPEPMGNVTPILTAVPPDNTRGRAGTRSTHGGNPDVQARQGMAEHVMWVRERPDGGRGFGFTGGHNHVNWGHDDFRKLVLNSILWIAKVDVPAVGVMSTVDEEGLKANLDPKGGATPKIQIPKSN